MATFQERTLSIWDDQIKTKVFISGSGPAVVFLHGAFGLTWDQPFLEQLAARHTVYAPLHPGMTEGAPDGVRALETLWDLVLYYYELFDKLGLERPAVVGHSFGGMVACEVAATDPKRVSKLVLFCPIGLWRDDAPIRNYMVTPMTELAPLVLADLTSPLARRIFTPPADAEAQANLTIQTIWALGCTGKFIWPLPDKGLKKRLHRITAPALIVWGEQDRLTAPVYAQEFAGKLANSRVEQIDKAAHLPHLEQMAQVSDLVNGFLAS